MSKKSVCERCKGPHSRRSRYCSKRCGDAVYRQLHHAEIKKGISAANRRRWRVDPAFREAHRMQKTNWAKRKRAVIGVRTKDGPFRSQMEERLAAKLLAAGASYESLRFTFPARRRGYLPDFILPNGIVIEAKGWFVGGDRAKMLAVKKEHPNLDIRFVLASPRQFTTQNRTMTQAEWCEKHGFPWAEAVVPDAWLVEQPKAACQEALTRGVAVKKKARCA